MTEHYDFIVIGGGIAGVAVAAELAPHGKVVVIEQEGRLAYHTTGRSAAILMESYGNALIRTLTCQSRPHFEHNSEGKSASPLSSPRGALILADESYYDSLKTRYQAVVQHVPSANLLDERQVAEMVDFLAPGKWVAGIYEPTAVDLDVHAIHSAYVSAVRRSGGSLKTNAQVVNSQWSGTSWEVILANGERVGGAFIVNAAGAWADQVAKACGIRPLGIKPLRRTVIMIDPERDVSLCPYIGTVDEYIFFKPDVQRLIVSPCDETTDSPRDVYADEMDVAITMSRLETATILRPASILNSWAGLRVFVPDRSPVIGPDPLHGSFYWCAAFGGYGIQISPAMSKLCASLLLHKNTSKEINGIVLDDVSPARTFYGVDNSRMVAVAELK